MNSKWSAKLQRLSLAGPTFCCARRDEKLGWRSFGMKDEVQHALVALW